MQHVFRAARGAAGRFSTLARWGLAANAARADIVGMGAGGGGGVGGRQGGGEGKGIGRDQCGEGGGWRGDGLTGLDFFGG